MLTLSAVYYLLYYDVCLNQTSLTMRHDIRFQGLNIRIIGWMSNSHAFILFFIDIYFCFYKASSKQYKSSHIRNHYPFIVYKTVILLSNWLDCINSHMTPRLTSYESDHVTYWYDQLCQWLPPSLGDNSNFMLHTWLLALSANSSLLYDIKRLF